MDKLSILISSYNRHDIIYKSIKSILNSNIPRCLEIEVIIVDDCSNEKTWNEIKRFKHDPRFIIHRNEKRKGTGGENWNKAFELSSGNIITNNEDDMIWHEDYIKILYNELKEHDKYTCLFGMYIQTEDPDNLRPPKTQPKDPYPDYGLFTGIPRKKSIIPSEHVCHNQYFCRREFFEGLDELWPTLVKGSGLREEDDLFLRTLKLKPKRKYLAVPSAYLWHIYRAPGGYHLDKKRSEKNNHLSHKIFLKRNFGNRYYYMIVFYHIHSKIKTLKEKLGRIKNKLFKKK